MESERLPIRCCWLVFPFIILPCFLSGCEDDSLGNHGTKGTSHTSTTTVALAPSAAPTPPTDIGVLESGQKDCGCCTALTPDCNTCQEECDSRASGGNQASTPPPETLRGGPTPKPAVPSTLWLVFSIENIEFGAMTETHQNEMTSGIKTTVASNTGVPENNIDVALSAGSVAVDVTITVPNHMDAGTIKNAVDIKQAAITATVVSDARAITGLPTYGAVSVSGFIVRTSPACPSFTTSGTCPEGCWWDSACQASCMTDLDCASRICAPWGYCSTWVRSDKNDAEFLIQATFGPTRSSMDALKEVTYSSWIEQQMGLPVESHRSYYRSRVNSRSTDPMPTGNRHSPCKQGSRWHEISFSIADTKKNIRVQNNEIYVEGVLRTAIDPVGTGNGISALQKEACTDAAPSWNEKQGLTCNDLFNSRQLWCASETWIASKYCQQVCYDQGMGYDGDDCSSSWVSFQFEGYICMVEERVGGRVIVSTDVACSVTSKRIGMANPAIWLTDPLQFTEVAAQFHTLRPGIFLLKEDISSCSLNDGSFIQSSGKHYLHNSRLELVENTVENPSGSASDSKYCAAVAKTFLNEGGCKLQPSCTPLHMAKVVVPMTKETFEILYNNAQRYVYSIAGLRTSTSPCGTLSRWKRINCQTADCTASLLGSTDIEGITTQLETKGGWLRDIHAVCQAVPAGATVELNGEFFHHVHLQEHNVYDFTDWISKHPGGMDKISKWINHDFEVSFPPSHEMNRWTQAQSHLTYIGRLEDVLEVAFEDLPTDLKSSAVVDAFIPENSTAVSFESCGSPEEVANDPRLGNGVSFWSKYVPVQNANDERYTDLDLDFPYSKQPSFKVTKQSVWTMKALYAKDQLRQRMAWALAQIFVTGHAGFGKNEYNEMWISYYDIFVRNAFGNFRDVLREVTYSTLMGDYLTFKKNTKFDHDNNYPDENYAREIMQLFTIGLWELNPDGSHVKVNGNDVPTYDNDDIMNFARVFTGFDGQAPRANIEEEKGANNYVDPMQMKANWHDVYPKPDLDGGFLGDGYPLCADLAPRSFLAKGARYEFRGYVHDEADGVFVASQESTLYIALCGDVSSCVFKRTVVLEATLDCHEKECDMDTPQTVRVGTGFYEYMPPPCVHLFFYNGHVAASGGGFFKHWKDKCENPDSFAAGVSCCVGCTNKVTSYMTENGKTCEAANVTWKNMYARQCNQSDWWSERQNKFCQLACWEGGVGYDGDDCSAGALRHERVCAYSKELFRFRTAEDICTKRGMHICDVEPSAAKCSFDDFRVWTQSTCTQRVEVNAEGKVSLQTDENTKQNRFSVPWLSGYPTVEGNCSSVCTVNGNSCACDIHVETVPVFDRVPGKGELLAELTIHAWPPKGACTSCTGDVKAYAVGGVIDKTTVFECDGKFFKNANSLVRIGNYHFRNPPVFMLREAPTNRAALAEVESLLDHLFHHANTPQFFSYRLIQRFTTSNPSSTYIRDVANAFKTGRVNGAIYNGAYGDLAATIAAVLLHPEVRLQSMETTGSLREPVIKLIHFMRAMEYADGQREVIFQDELVDVIGEGPFQSPSVFNFYRPDYQPSSFPTGLVAPEFQIYTAPNSVGLLNSFMSLIQHGLSACDEGLGISRNPCKDGGGLTLEDLGSENETLSMLDLLLTGGRLGATGAVRTAYQHAADGDQLRAAQRTIVMTPEFNTLGNPFFQGEVSTSIMETSKDTKPVSSYKAMVMIFLNGGADTFNMIVPLKCGLYDEYVQVRNDIALLPNQLHEIQTDGQTCKSFGVHYNLPYLKSLYDRKRVAFVSNIGSLVEPTTKMQFKTGGASKCVGLFSHSDQQAGAQTLQCQTPGAAPKGFGGRLADALASSQFRTTSFSTAGTSTWPQGFGTNAQIIDKRKGVVRLIEHETLQTAIGNVTSQKYKNMYADEYNNQFAQAIKSSEELGDFLDNVELRTTYNDVSGLAKQLHQVARLIAAREERKAERDFFFVELGGFDTHSDAEETLVEKFNEMNAAIEGFVAEIEAQGVFDSVVIASESDFGRSLTSNGAGTDHAWAGNHFVIGGAINGGNILNDFPASLIEGNEQDAGRGRIIPKYPWESMMVPIAEWMGAEPSQLSTVFPNLANFNKSIYIIDRTTLFAG